MSVVGISLLTLLVARRKEQFLVIDMFIKGKWKEEKQDLEW